MIMCNICCKYKEDKYIKENGSCNECEKNKNNELKIKCINDLVDGISKGNIYNVSVIRKRNDGLLSYFLKDDYGQYNEFKSDRFEIIECYVEL